MRAGSLSDPRVVVLLRRHFVPVSTTLLHTPELIEDRRDLAVLTALDRTRHATGTVSMDGGVKELFLSPEGKLLGVAESLHQGYRGGQTLYRLADRLEPDETVERFFRVARASLLAFGKRIPDDFEAIRDGSDPEVRELSMKAFPTLGDAVDAPTLRVWSRSDAPMYQALVGRRLLPLDGITLPGFDKKDAVGEMREWARDSIIALARAAIPRGCVAARPHAKDIDGIIVSTLTGRRNDRLTASIRGQIEILPCDDDSMGARDNCRAPFHLDVDIDGEFVIDATSGKVVELRIASSDASIRYFNRFEYAKERNYALAVELLVPE